MNQIFKNVGSLKPDRNLFNLSHSVSGDATFGFIYPVLCRNIEPGAVLRMQADIVMRLRPLVTALMHEVDVHLYAFFVPHRILDVYTPAVGSMYVPDLWPEFESVYSGGYKGTESRDFPRMSATFLAGSTYLNPKVSLPSSWCVDGVIPSGSGDIVSLKHSFFDYARLLNPLAYNPTGELEYAIYGSFIRSNLLAYPLAAYNRIYVDYFADENLETDKFENQVGVPDKSSYFVHHNLSLQLGNWDKDYFTSALPFQQRGTAPALPVEITGSAGIGLTGFGFNQLVYEGDNAELYFVGNNDTGYPASFSDSHVISSTTPPDGKIAGAHFISGNGNISGIVGVQGSVNGSDFTATTFNVSDLRLVVQTQKWMERNARAGVRFTELIKAHFGVSPTDARLDRPEYLGGTVAHVVVSEVLQTAPTGASLGSGIENQENYLGDYAGHGIVASHDMLINNYHVEEPGTLMVLMCIKPAVSYMQDSPREWYWKEREDWFWPEYVALSEQAISNFELYSDSSMTADELSDIFGYQGRYDELRTAHSGVVGSLRDTEDYWTLARKFSSIPQLSMEFIKINPYSDDLMRVFQYQGTSENPAYPFIFTIGFEFSALRPMPFIAEPGLVDHF